MFKTAFLLITAFCVAYAGSMYFVDYSAIDLAKQLAHIVGPTMMVAFGGIFVWGATSAIALRSSNPERVEKAEDHLNLVIINSKTLAICGTFAGLLSMMSELAQMASQGPEAFATAVPQMLSGIKLVLSSSIAGYSLAAVFENVRGLTPRPYESSQTTPVEPVFASPVASFNATSSLDQSHSSSEATSYRGGDDLDDGADDLEDDEDDFDDFDDDIDREFQSHFRRNATA